MSKRKLRLSNFSYLGNPKIAVILMIITVLLIIIDTSISKIYYTGFNQGVPLDSKVIIFTLLGFIGFITQYLLIKYVERKIFENPTKDSIKIVYWIIYCFQYALILTYLVLVFELFINNKYHSSVLIWVTIGSSGIAIFILSSLGKIFLKWYKIEKNHVLLIYSLAVFSLSFSIIFASTITTLYLLNKPDVIYRHYGIVSPYYYENIIEFLSNGYAISTISGFVLSWIGILFMLNQYSIRWKKRAHWVIISIPMLYFFIQFTPIVEYILYSVNLPHIPYAIFYTLFVEYNQLVGGIVFGGAFWTLSRTLASKGIRFELPMIAGYGFLLLFITNQSIILSPANYPPFGVFTLSLLPLACALLFLGVYSSALTISLNIKLKKAIQTIVKKKSNMLLSMSVSEAITSLESQITEIYVQLSEETANMGMKTTTSIEDAKDYLDNELKEMLYLIKKDESPGNQAYEKPD